MKIAIGGDHPAYELKEAVKRYLSEQGIDVVDVGTHSTESVDYPEFGAAVGRLVRDGSVDRGIVICGTGLGISIAANKIEGIRAALCVNTDYARLAREHNDANVLALGARFTAAPHAAEIVRVWLETPFGGGRHERRIEQIRRLDAGDEPASG
ncbi:ribose 5-phosphate isomerase B [Candidatus Poribacteria bacterium]|nr:ribose 5-phosphate isomerase B [Candidatus Poribacteria bacterium]